MICDREDKSEHKSARKSSFIPRRERSVKAFSLGKVLSLDFSALNRTIAATMGESTNHAVNCSLHVSATSDRRIARAPGSGDIIRGDKASMRKREKETANVRAHMW